MSITVNLAPQAEEQLRDRAARQGVAPEDYIRRLVELDLGGLKESGFLWRHGSPDEWERVAREWVDSHDRSIPLLPDEAVTRESLYDREP